MLVPEGGQGKYLAAPIAQAVSRWVPTAAARVWSSGMWWTVALGQVFSEYFGFPCLPLAVTGDVETGQGGRQKYNLRSWLMKDARQKKENKKYYYYK
jgi:hypothetical protein